MRNLIVLSIFTLLFLFNKSAIAQEYFEIEPTFNCNCGEFTKKLSELKTYSKPQISELFNKIAFESEMEFRYPQGGCQQRAEMMHKLLKDLDIEHAKVWLFAPIDLEDGNSTQLEIKDENGLAPDSTIKWGYHVAPCILRKSDNKIDTLVIDPSIRKKAPMLLGDWLNSIKNSDVSKYTFLDAKYYFFNTQNNGKSPVIDGYFYPYEPIDGSVTMYDNATVERELAVNDVAMFLKEKLDSGYSDQNGEIKTLLGSVENLISVFSAQQRCNQLNGVSMRILLENHSKLIKEAMDYYNERVVFWVNK
jgi:hypothetical protein